MSERNSPTRSFVIVMPRLSTISDICSTVGRFTLMTSLLVPMVSGRHRGSTRMTSVADTDEFVDKAVAVQFVRLSGMHDCPLLYDQDSFGQRRDEVEILLDEDHRQPAFRTKA